MKSFKNIKRNKSFIKKNIEAIKKSQKKKKLQPINPITFKPKINSKSKILAAKSKKLKKKSKKKSSKKIFRVNKKTDEILKDKLLNDIYLVLTDMLIIEEEDVRGLEEVFFGQE